MSAGYPTPALCLALTENDLKQFFIGSRQELHRFLARRVRCHETAADLVQEVYLRLPELAPIPCSEWAVRAWLFRVAGNLAIDHVRSVKRRGALLERFYGGETEEDKAPTPDRALLDCERLVRVTDALAELPEQCAEVLYLSRVQGLSHAAIADQLGISKSWVEKQIVRALNHCRLAVNDEGE